MTADQLRKSILQQAIQGKLVPQDPNDEPASVLLERIREEKARLVKEKKIKKEKNPSIIFRGEDNSHYEKFILTGEVKCIDDEIPFDLPKGWEWCIVGDLFLHNNGKQLNKDNTVGTLMKYITTSNLYWDGFRLDNLKTMPFENKEIERCQALKGDLLVCEGGDIGRSCIWEHDESIMLQNHIHKLRAYLPICTKYFYYIFYLYNLSGIIGGKGIGIQGFSSKALHYTRVPLPPLEEQQRIVAKIEELMLLVEQYGKAQSELEALNSNIREQIKKSVLQYAIEGKLVPQCEEDGTAEDLLQEIQAEKQRLYTEGKLKKKDLTHSTIFRGEDNKYYEQIGKEVSDITEEIPYDLPNGWSFCRLSVLCWLDDGSKHFDEVLPYLDAKYQRGHSLPTYIQEGRLVEAQSKVILVDGENSGEVFITRERGYLGSTFKLLQSMPQVSATWMQYVLENYRPLLKGSKVGAAIPHLNKKLFHNLIIGLPCRKEQEFIAEQLDSIFQLIEG